MGRGNEEDDPHTTTALSPYRNPILVTHGAMIDAAGLSRNLSQHRDHVNFLLVSRNYHIVLKIAVCLKVGPQLLEVGMLHEKCGICPEA